MKNDKSILNSIKIRNYIRSERKKRKIRGDDLSVLVGKGKAYISQIESGKIKYIPEDTLKSILEQIHELDYEAPDAQQIIEDLVNVDSAASYENNLSFDDIFAPVTNIFRYIYEKGDETTKENMVNTFITLDSNMSNYKNETLKILNISLPDINGYDLSIIKKTYEMINFEINSFRRKIDDIRNYADINNYHKMFPIKYNKVKTTINKLTNDEIKNDKFKVWEIGLNLNGLLVMIDNFFKASLKCGETSNLNECKKSINSLLILQRLLKTLLGKNYTIPMPLTTASEDDIKNKMKEIKETNLYFTLYPANL